MKYKPGVVEKIILRLIAIMMIIAFALFFTNVRSFEKYVQEDWFLPVYCVL